VIELTTFNVLFLAASVPVNIYPFVYSTRSWRVTNAGQALMIQAWGSLILIDMGLATILFGPEYWGREAIRTVGMGVYFVGMSYLLGVLLATMRRPRDDPSRHKKPDRT
jgi:hypothetical protein